MDNQQIIDRIKTRLVSKGMLKGDEVSTQGYLRVGANLQAAALNTINFNVLSNQGTVRATERRLNITDLFTVTHWCLYLVKAGGLAGGAGALAVDADIAIARNYTYPNPYVFGSVAQGAPTFLTNTTVGQLVPFTTESNNLTSIYNGFMSVTIDREVILDSYDCMRFLRVPGSQQQMAQAAAAIAPAIGTIGYSAGATFDEWTSGEYGFSAVDPQFTLNGIGDNVLQITLPAALNLGGISSTNFAFLTMRGIRWQNASKLNA
jgi:hypothetical protein